MWALAMKGISCHNFELVDYGKTTCVLGSTPLVMNRIRVV